jgi:spore germination cell wall hydrolase CwlJ-like protein
MLNFFSILLWLINIININPVDEDSVLCMTQNIYFEARSESKKGRAAVAFVTMNRVESSKFPNTICDVVWDRKQFSWTHDGKSDWPAKNKIEMKAWKECKQMAYTFLYFWPTLKYMDHTNKSTHYHADHISPFWNVAYNESARIGSHIFYNEAP